MSIPKSYWRIFTVIFFDVVFSFILYYGFVLISSPFPNKWIIGDWLINYQGGIVRRGLFGEIFLRLSQLTNTNLIALIVIFLILMYLFFLVNVYRLSINSPFSALTTALIFSPAFILFSVLDPQGAFRKEMLLFVLLSTLCCYLALSRSDISKSLPIYISVISVIIVLSHEMLVVYLPYLIGALIIHENGLGTSAKKTIISVVPAIIIVIILVSFGKGDMQIVNSICSSLKASAPADCIFPDTTLGSISFLGKDLSSAHSFVLNSFNKDTILAYVLTAILGFTPIVLISFSKQIAVIKNNKAVRMWLGICIFSTMICSIPLFWVVADYGRIIYIHVTCLSLLTLMAMQQKDNASLRLTFKQTIMWALSFLFIGSWRLIHFSASVDKAFPIAKLVFEYFFNK